MVESRVAVVVLLVFARRQARGGEEVGTVEEGDGTCPPRDGGEVRRWIGHGMEGRAEGGKGPGGAVGVHSCDACLVHERGMAGDKLEDGAVR